jgi:guanyl-specific ribonuclease Sa
MRLKNFIKNLSAVLLMMVLILSFGCQNNDKTLNKEEPVLRESQNKNISEDFNSRDKVALYIYENNELPDYYMTKKEAGTLGWLASEGNLWEVSKGAVIGGDIFYNREGLLPEKKDRIYFEADINYYGGYRSAERIVFSNDGLIYYTKDHYETFELLYGDE